jgi:TetR/AcrR family transcriptional repressor of nem operon
LNSSPYRKEETRRRIVDTAARLFLAKGVDRVGVDEIMRECGLTHGGFYGYFPSKKALISEACTAALQEAFGRWQERARQLGDDMAWADFLTHYLAGDLTSPDNPASPTAILGADVARRRGAIQASYVALIRSLIDKFAEDAGADRPHAILSIAAMVGATSLAAQVGQDKALATEILDVTRDELLKRRPRASD